MHVQLRNLGLSTNHHLYSWQEKRAEVEFLAVIEDQILPIEVKSGRVQKAKSLKQFADKYHPSYRTIISAKPLMIDQENQFHRYPLYLTYRFPLS